MAYTPRIFNLILNQGGSQKYNYVRTLITVNSEDEKDEFSVSF